MRQLLQETERLWRYVTSNPGYFDKDRGTIEAPDSLAISVCTLWTRLHDSGAIVPAHLEQILREIATNSDFRSRRFLLQSLHHIIHRDSALGWKILKLALTDAPGELFTYAENCFYCNYSREYKRVEIYLDYIRKNHMEVASGTWGRITALASLHGLVKLEDLFTWLQDAPQDAWDGVARVYCHNIDNRQLTSICIDGLKRILCCPHASSLHRTLETVFKQDSHACILTEHIATQYINIEPFDHGYFNGFHFQPWLARKVTSSPRAVLTVLETLGHRLKSEKCRLSTHSEYVLQAMSFILNDAEEEGDTVYLRRSLRALDTLHAINPEKGDEFLKLAGQEA